MLQNAVDVVHGANPARSHNDLLMHARSILENEALLDLVHADIRYVPLTPTVSEKRAVAVEPTPAAAPAGAAPAAQRHASSDNSAATATATVASCATRRANDLDGGDSGDDEDNLSDIDDAEIDALIRTDDQVAALQRNREWLQDVIAGKRSHADTAADEPQGARVRSS